MSERCVHIFVLVGHSGSSWQRKTKVIYAYEQYIQKNSNKIKKMIFLASKRLECTRCLQVLVIKWRTRRSREKNKIVHFFKVFWAKICFFLHELLRCPNTTKTCTHLANLNIFSPTNFHNFLIFFLFFLNLLLACVQNLCFPLTRAPEVSERHENVHAPCGHDYLRSHQISCFFIFLLFFRTVKDLWPDGNGREGHFYKWN